MTQIDNSGLDGTFGLLLTFGGSLLQQLSRYIEIVFDDDGDYIGDDDRSTMMKAVTMVMISMTTMMISMTTLVILNTTAIHSYTEAERDSWRTAIESASHAQVLDHHHHTDHNVMIIMII